MNPYLKNVKPLKNYQLMLWFDNGEQKLFDLKPYLNKGIFHQLQNPAIFASARVVSGSIEWSSGLDLSYDTLYLEAKSLETNLQITDDDPVDEFTGVFQNNIPDDGIRN
jgi:hypothetical protein